MARSCLFQSLVVPPFQDAGQKGYFTLPKGYVSTEQEPGGLCEIA